MNAYGAIWKNRLLTSEEKKKSSMPPGSLETARHSAQAKGGGSCALPGQSAKNSSYSMDSKYKPD